MCCINVFVFKQAPLLLLMVSFNQEFEFNLLDGAAQEHNSEAVKGGIVPAKRGLNCWQDCLKPGEDPTNLKAMKQAKDRFRRVPEKQERDTAHACFLLRISLFYICLAVGGSAVVSKSRCLLQCCVCMCVWWLCMFWAGGARDVGSGSISRSSATTRQINAIQIWVSKHKLASWPKFKVCACVFHY